MPVGAWGEVVMKQPHREIDFCSRFYSVICAGTYWYRPGTLTGSFPTNAQGASLCAARRICRGHISKLGCLRIFLARLASCRACRLVAHAPDCETKHPLLAFFFTILTQMLTWSGPSRLTPSSESCKGQSLLMLCSVLTLCFYVCSVDLDPKFACQPFSNMTAKGEPLTVSTRAALSPLPRPHTHPHFLLLV